MGVRPLRILRSRLSRSAYWASSGDSASCTIATAQRDCCLPHNLRTLRLIKQPPFSCRALSYLWQQRILHSPLAKRAAACLVRWGEPE